MLETGFGSILGHIAVIIGLGTLLGSILERSGGARYSPGPLRGFGERGAARDGCAGLIFGIPVFFDIGIFVLAPLVYVAAKQGGRSLVLYAMPLIAGLSITHAFLPPHPGPVAAAGLLHVELGWIILMGLACGIPAFLVGGVLYATWIGKRIDVEVPQEMIVAEEEGEQEEDVPSLALVGSIIAVPLVLILAGTFGSIWLRRAPRCRASPRSSARPPSRSPSPCCWRPGCSGCGAGSPARTSTNWPRSRCGRSR